MATRPKTNVSDLTFEQIEMIANFSDYSADYPALSLTDRKGEKFSIGRVGYSGAGAVCERIRTQA
jgi:hypothetical protein